MKKYVFLLVLILCSILGMQSQNVALPYFQDFAALTDGNTIAEENSNTAVATPLNGISAYSAAYQAGGVIRLGDLGSIGDITTNPVNVGDVAKLKVAFNAVPLPSTTSMPAKIVVVYGSQSDTIALPAIAHDWAVSFGDLEQYYTIFNPESTPTAIEIKTVAGSGLEPRVFFDNLSLKGLVLGDPLVEDFTPRTFPPVSWVIHNVLGSTTWNRANLITSQGGVARLNYGSTEEEDWLVMPRVMASSGQALTFKARVGSTATTNLTSLGVWVSTTGDEVSDFNQELLLLTNTSVDDATKLTSDFTTFTVDLSNYVNVPIYLAFKGTTNNSTLIYVDDVRGPNLFPIACDAPTALTVPLVTETTATLNWVESGEATAWVVEYGTSSTFAQNTVETTSETTLNITGLSPNTLYYARVRSNCLGGDFSQWVSISFRTPCHAVSLPLFEDFESYEPYVASIGISEIPDCWAKVSTHSAFPGVVSAATSNGLESQTMRFSGSKPQYLVLPPISEPLNTLQVKFDLNKQNGAAGSLQVGYMTSPSNASSFVAVATVTNDQFITFMPKQVFFSNAPSDEGPYYIAFRYGDTEGVTTNINSILWIDNVEVSFAPPCITPNNIVVFDKTITSAKITYTTPTATANAWDYAITDDMSVEIPTGLEVNMISNDTIELTGLTAGTKYKIWVRTNCGNGDYSDWTIDPIVFSTVCDSIEGAWSEDFTERDADNLYRPYCWTVSSSFQGTLSFPYIVTSQGRGEPRGALLFYAPNVAANANIIATTAFSTPLNTYEVTFWAANNAGTPNLEVGVMSDADDANTFLPLDTVTPTSTVNTSNPNLTEWTMYEVSLAGAPITHKHIAFRFKNNSSASASCYIDDVGLQLISSCVKPTNLTITNITDTSATITFNEVGTATSWQYAITSAMAETDLSSVNEQTISSTTYEITGLDSSTEYKVWVRSVCGSGEYSPWYTIPVEFKTLCGKVDMLIETFNEVSTTTASIPDCWTKITNDSEYPKVVNAGSAIGISSKAIRFGSSKPQFLVTPQFNVPLSSLKLSFDLNSEAAACGYFLVGYMSDPADDNTFVEVARFRNSVYEQYVPCEVIFSGVPDNNGANRYIAFRYGDVAGTSQSYLYYYWLDNVQITEIPSCSPPTALEAFNISSVSATICFTEVGTATAWQYVLTDDISVTDPTTLTPINVSNDTVAITGLQPSTAYRVWVRSACGTNFSEWRTIPLTFTTNCAIISIPAEGWNETFSSPADPATDIPYCWTNVTTSVDLEAMSFPVHTGDDGYNAPGCIAMVPFPDQGYTVNLIASPEFDNPLSGYMLSLAAKKTVNLATLLEVGVMSNVSDAGTFVALHTISPTTLDQWETFEVLLNNAPATHKFLAFRVTSVYSHTAKVTFDDIQLYMPGTCSRPTGVVSADITDVSANVSFTPASGASAWQYAITDNPDIIDPNQLDAINTSTNTIELTELTPNTQYKVWVRSDCGNNEYSLWSLSFANFKTECAVTVNAGWTEHFNSSHTTTEFPHCWTKVTGYVSQYNYLYPYVNESEGYSRLGALNFRVDGYNNPTNLVATPQFSGDLSQMNVAFWLKRMDITASSIFEVGVMSDVTNTNSFTSVQEVTLANTGWNLIEVSLAGVDTANKHIAFRLTNSGGSNAIYMLDDVNVYLSAGCVRPSALAVPQATVTATDATIEWTVRGSETDWSLQYKVATEAIWQTIDNITTNPYVITGLTPATRYQVRIKANCAANGESLWTEPVNFTTQCMAEVLPFNETFTSTTFPPTECWGRYYELADNVFNGTPFTTQSYSWERGTDNNGMPAGKAKIAVISSLVKDWLLMPVVALQPNSVLEFDLAYTAYGSGDNPSQNGLDDKFMVVVSQNGGATWNASNAIVWSNDGSGNYSLNTVTNTSQRYTIDLSQYSGNVRIGFYAESTVANAMNEIHLDNITVRELVIVPPTITTIAATNITENSATLNKNIVQGTFAIDSEGFFYQAINDSRWSTSADGNITGLSSGTTYRFYAYAIVSGVTHRGDTLQFTTEGEATVPPTVTTLDATLVTQTTATLNKDVVAHTSEPVITQGWRYKKVVDDNWLTTTVAELTNLSPDTEYEFYAFATTSLNASGYVGETLVFTTLAHVQPTVVTGAVTDVQANSATLAKTVTAGTELIREEGWYYKRVADGNNSWTKTISANIANLSPSTAYHYFAFASTDTYTLITGDTIVFTTGAQVGLDIADHKVEIYPNPANSVITIAIDGINADADVVIMDALGRTIGKYSIVNGSNSITVDVTSFAEGSYIVHIVTDNKVMTDRLVIKK